MSRVPVLQERGVSLGKGLAWGAGVIKTMAEVHLLLPLKRRPLNPRVLTIYVTYRCNSRCRICGIWREGAPGDSGGELSLPEMERIISDPLFRRLESVNINGGEPNLRSDLPEIAAMFLRRLPRLRAISVNSNGIPPEATERNARKIAAACREKGVRLSVSLSLHGTGPLFDRISGIPGGYAGIMESFARLKSVRKEIPFHLSANCVITNMNVDRLEDLRAWSRTEGVPVAFALGEVRDRFHNQDMERDILLGEDGRKTLVSFLRRLARQKKESRQHAFRYARLADMLEKGEARTLSCHFFMGGAVLSADGRLFYCKNSSPLGDCLERSAEAIYFDRASLAYRREGLKKGRCPSCPPYTMNQQEIARDFFPLLSFLAFGRPKEKGKR